MGRKAFIPYGLYVVKISISANLAKKTGFSNADLDVLLKSIMLMYNDTISSSKMGMSVLSPLVLFKHVGTQGEGNAEQNMREAMLGCAPSYKLFDLLQIERKENVPVARSYKDYNCSLNLSALPKGVVCGLKDSAFEDVRWIDKREDIKLF